MMSTHADVVVSGAGPAGLMLANELALAGASVVVVERLAARDPTIKAGALGAPGGEALERRGFGPEMAATERVAAELMAGMVARAQPPAGTAPAGAGLPWKKLGGHFAGLFLIDQTRQREPDRRLRGVHQQALEGMLETRAVASGVDLRRACEIEGFDDDGEEGGCVVVRVRAAGEERELRAGYLVGCDGGRSLVRKRAGFDFPGTEPTLTGHPALVGMLAYGPVPRSAGGPSNSTTKTRPARGAMPGSLLDTYTTERHPVAVGVLANTRAQVALMRPDAITTELRTIVTRLMQLDEGNRFFGEMMSGLGLRHDVDAAGGPAAKRAAPWAPRVRAVAAAGDAAMLVRPDGCVAWARAAGLTEGLAEALERWFGAA